MKKLLFFLALTIVSISFILLITGCSSIGKTEKVNVLDKVAKVSLVQNPELAASILAKGVYTGYLLIQKDGKHEKEIKAIQDLYFELLKAEQADEKPKLAAVNRAGLTVLRAAAIAKWGFVRGELLADATEVAGMIIDARIKKKISDTAEERFMSTFITVLKECVANTPALEKELEEDCINCDVCERIKRELARDDLTPEERAEYEAMLKQYQCDDQGLIPICE